MVYVLWSLKLKVYFNMYTYTCLYVNVLEWFRFIDNVHFQTTMAPARMETR